MLHLLHKTVMVLFITTVLRMTIIFLKIPSLLLLYVLLFLKSVGHRLPATRLVIQVIKVMVLLLIATFITSTLRLFAIGTMVLVRVLLRAVIGLFSALVLFSVYF